MPYANHVYNFDSNICALFFLERSISTFKTVNVEDNGHQMRKKGGKHSPRVSDKGVARSAMREKKLAKALRDNLKRRRSSNTPKGDSICKE